MNQVSRSASVVLLLIASLFAMPSAAAGNGVLVVFKSQADLKGATQMRHRNDRLHWTYDELRAAASASQAPVARWLSSRGIPHRRFFSANAIWADLTLTEAQALARFPAVSRVVSNSVASVPMPQPDRQATVRGGGSSWNLDMIGAPVVWDLGNEGAGIVVASADTGVDGAHVDLAQTYRGAVGNQGPVGHDYNWFDGACHGVNCGSPLVAPMDPHGHGTHTTGIMTGRGETQPIGVAPAANWIACRNMDETGDGSPATYLACFDWFLAPTNVQGKLPDPSLAPHIVNNSWGCPPSEGCGDVTILDTALQSLLSAGIVVVAAAGNSGSSCSSVSRPPAIFEGSLTIGSVNLTGDVNAFSARGPVVVDGSGRRKPDLMAPGDAILSTLAGGGYGFSSGTSMAAPHVAGAAALILAQDPSLIGDTSAVGALLTGTALPQTTTQGCGGDSDTVVPNNVHGHGRLDAMQSVIAADTVFFASFD